MPRSSSLWSLCLLTLGACASTPRPTTLHLNAWLGASDDGRYACAEILEAPGDPLVALQRVIGSDGALVAETSLTPEQVEGVLSVVRHDPLSPTLTDSALTPLAPEGFDRTKGVVWVPAPGGPWQVELQPGVRVELSLVTAEGPGSELRLTLRLTGERDELVLHKLARTDGLWLSRVVLLPQGRRALLLYGAATDSSRGLHRLEGLVELEVGRAASALLDARAVEALKRGEQAAARADLERAVGVAPADPIAHYNLACAYALSGEQDRALLSLGRAVGLAPALKGQALADPDLEPLRERVEYKLMVEPRPDSR